MAMTIEKRDPYTAGHQTRVTRLALAIADHLGLEAERRQGLRLAALIHDIGKVYVPAEILNRPGRLTDAEFALIRTHPRQGYEILANIEFFWPVADSVHQRHERLDGSGYPRGLAGDDILLEARIPAVADTVEAMASHRPYRPGKPLEKALAEITNQQGRKYDADAVSTCRTLFLEEGFSWESEGDVPGPEGPEALRPPAEP